MGRRMYRYVVPADDRSHEFTLTSDPVAVAPVPVDIGEHEVEFWAEHDDDAGASDRAFQVFGTGHLIPDGGRWIGTCGRIQGAVWHLYEVTDHA